MKSRGSERRGTPVSPGIAIGPAYVLRRERIVIPEHRIRDEQADGEVERLRMAFAETRATLEEIRRGMQGTGLVGTIRRAVPVSRTRPKAARAEHGG